MEPDLYDDLKRTLERDIRVLESFSIMDYSLLLGIHNISVNKQETLKSRKPNLETRPYSDQVSSVFFVAISFSILDHVGINICLAGMLELRKISKKEVNLKRQGFNL